MKDVDKHLTPEMQQAERQLAESQHRIVELERLLGLEMAKVVGHTVMREQAEARLAAQLDLKPSRFEMMAKISMLEDNLAEVVAALDRLLGAVKDLREHHADGPSLIELADAAGKAEKALATARGEQPSADPADSPSPPRS